MNEEFQELRRQWSVNFAMRATIIADMRVNLTQRNGGNDEYTFRYKQQGPMVNISTAEVAGRNGLLAIDGDMNPRGL